MNVKDNKLMKTIISNIKDLEKGKNVLFTVNYMQISKMNLILLKGLLEELSKKGIFVAVDRPHQYMEHLLRMHRINYAHLLFLDTISRFSGFRMEGINNGEKVKILDSPFQIDLLPELFIFDRIDNREAEGVIDLSAVDFILIDNVAAMLNYNDHEMVKGFLKKFLSKFKGNNDTLIPILLDKNTHGALFEVVSELCQKHIDLNSTFKEKNDEEHKRREKKVFLDKRNLADLYSYRKCLKGGG